MKKVEVTCRLITPLFMYGTTNKPEIRASSIKGVLRYWWRFFNYDGDEESFKNRENYIFGSVDNKSPVQIRVERDKNKCEIEKNKNILQEKNNKKSGNENYGGIKYLFYFLNAGENKNKSYVKENSEFKIQFRYIDESVVKEYLEALNWLQLFGGMGSRSRRGAGNFKIIKISGNDELAEEYRSKLILDFEDNKMYQNDLFKDKISIYRFKNGQGENWLKVLDAIGKKYKAFRNVKNEDIYGEKFQSEHKAVFGLPIGGKVKSDKVTKIKRMESPLIFKVLEIEKEKYECIVIRLHNSPLEKEEKLKKDDESLIDKFLQQDCFERIVLPEEVKG
ncbi:CRISPR-associated protein Cmr1 [Caminicella sporogenes DSM 14501]|uniref:CRISPR-associated protein Cmr1 n=1 Tax=Caminicella sporogenes DSM 14501 TaxID=1121266 RepID=A0A1M6LT60_9FIRM|nr:type III-B CRISPR module RAMP protein Cmr1 [Caminicella sporogenes]RKD27942.1 type III-B CRISPR module RAMP protein Cmr1 [Caminicella sporogenes]SHJ74369.1 CRISPR-associated protein Cmr1 [Caminicella sporogenes DSM 14501]